MEYKAAYTSTEFYRSLLIDLVLIGLLILTYYHNYAPINSEAIKLAVAKGVELATTSKQIEAALNIGARKPINLMEMADSLIYVIGLLWNVTTFGAQRKDYKLGLKS